MIADAMVLFKPDRIETQFFSMNGFCKCLLKERTTLGWDESEFHVASLTGFEEQAQGPDGWLDRCPILHMDHADRHGCRGLVRRSFLWSDSATIR